MGQAVCAAAEWDSEQMNFLPHYNLELNKVIAAGQAAPVAYNLYNIARSSRVKKQPLGLLLGFVAE